MRRRNVIGLMVVGILVAAALVGGALFDRWSVAGGGLSRTTTHDLGDVIQGAQVEHVFVLGNDRDADLRIEAVVPWASTVVSVDSVLPAGDEGRIRLRLDTRPFRGPFTELVKVRFADDAEAGRWLRLRGRVVLPVQVEPKDRVYFFTVTGEEAEERLEIVNRQDRRLAVLDVRSSNPLFAAALEPIEPGRRYGLRIALAPSAPVGTHRGTISLTTDSPDYASLDVEVWARIQHPVHTSISRVDFARILFDALDLQAVSRKTVLVEKHRGTDFAVVGARTDVPFLSVAVVPQQPGRSFLVHVQIDRSRAARGAFRGTLVIETNDPEFPRFELPVTGEIL